jgi:hypothetical protein
MEGIEMETDTITKERTEGHTRYNTPDTLCYWRFHDLLYNGGGKKKLLMI